MGNNPNTSETLTLAQLIAWVESRNDCKALRFEPTTYKNLSVQQSHSESLILALARAANKSSQATADMLYATSWGRYQIMGFNLYGPEVGYNGTIADYLASPAQQDATFMRLIAKMGLGNLTPGTLASMPALRDHFALVWNGSSSYTEPLENALENFGFQIS